MSDDQLTDLQELIINSFPSPIAINYKRILSKDTYQDKVRQLILTFEFTMRALALVLISQYLLIDREKITDSKLNKLLREKLPRPSLGSWVEIIFTTLGVYKDHRDLLFINELHDAYWDDKNQKPRKGIRDLFDKLVIIRNRLAHELPPSNETEWQILFQESHNLLIKILEFLQFVSRYELIFIKEQSKTGMRFQIYKGQTIIEGEALVKIGEENKGDNWFYLSKITQKERRYLKLYPFLIAWEKDIDLTIEGIQNDAALLDKFSSSSIYYLATLLWKNFSREDEGLLADFFYNYEKSLDRKKSGVLSWENLRTTTQEITRQNIGDSIKKYNPALYLDRGEIRRVFEDFLTSDKTCLVITGKSGVGKTNFVMATIDAFREDQGVCILAFNGARLPTDDTLSELFKKELENRIELTSRTSPRKDDVWEILSTTSGMVDKQVIVFIDALNENPNAAVVLQKIDLLVGSSPYPWLKFVITSRPESWRVMNRKLKLAEHRYYWQHGEEEMGVELKEFSQTDPVSLTINIDKFSRDEANLAYQKYKTVFGLRTDYDDLTIEVRHALRDPLVLRLIAEIYKNAIIPPTLRINQIYADFVDALISSGRLAKKDVHFINREIVSRMANNFTNILSEDAVLSEKGLYEAVFNTDTLSNGEQINQSFENLINAEIIAPLPLTGSTNVSFKYERFYDYFLGEYYYQQYHNSPEKQNQYQKLVETIRAHSFLWGAVKNALIMEIESWQDELIFQLACQSNQTSQELAIATLTEYGQSNSNNQNLIKLLRRLLAVYKEHLGFGGRVRSYFSNKPTQKLDQISRSAAMTALEVARRLMLSNILEEAVQDLSQPVRVIAMRNIYYYWRINKSAGFDLFNRLAERTMSKVGIPQTSVIEACLGISILMMAHYNPNSEDGQEVGLKILNAWRRISRRLLLISETETAGHKFLKSAIRAFVINIIVRFVVSTQENFPPSRPSYITDVALFFESESKIKQRYERLADFFGSPINFSEINDDVLKAVPENDALTCFLVWLILITEGARNKENVLPLTERVAKLTLEQPTTGILASNIVHTIGRIALSQSSIDDNIYNLYINTAKNFLIKTRGFFYSNRGSRHSNLSLGEYGSILAARKNPEDANLYDHFLKIAVNDMDWEFFDALMHDLTGVAHNNPRKVLESLETLFPIKNNEVLIKVAISLSTIRIYHPDLVDDFLYNIDISSELYQHISRIEIKEDPWFHLLQAASATIILNLMETPEIRNEFAWIMKRATKEKNLGKLLNIMIKRIVNKITGDVIFNIS